MRRSIVDYLFRLDDLIRYVSLMNPKRWTILIVLLALLAGGFYAARFVMAYGFGKFPAPVVRSDVPVTTDIDWWGNDECLTVTNFNAKKIGDVSRGMLNAKQQFVIEYHIVGTLEHDGNFRPYVDSVFISDRFDIAENGDRYVDVLVHPRIDLQHDESYNGDSIPFDIRVQRRYRTYQWGPNEFRAKCAGHDSIATAHQAK